MLKAHWSDVQLSDCIEQIIDFRGKTPKKIGMEWGNGTIKALSAINVKQGYIDFDRECYLGSDELYNTWMTKGDCAKGDIVFTMEAPLGNVAIIPNDDKYILSQRVILMKTNSRVDYLYFYHYLASEFFQNELNKNSTGSTAKGIKQKKLVKLPIILPSKREQKKIAEILSTVDKKIDFINQKITLTQQLKVGLMQKLFSEGVGLQDKDGNWHSHAEFQNSPFGKIPKTWIATPLENVLDVIKDGTHFSPQSKEGPCKYLTSKNIRFGVLSLSNMSYISQEEHDRIYKACPVKYGDILLTKDGANTGNAAINTLDEQFSLLSSVAYLRGSPDKVSHGYLLQILLSPKGQSMMKAAMAGQAITRLTLKKIGAFVLPFAPISEQNEIEKILSTVDEKLRLLNELKTESQQLKKGLMQKLLTGDWRIPVDNSEAA